MKLDMSNPKHAQFALDAEQLIAYREVRDMLANMLRTLYSD